MLPDAEVIICYCLKCGVKLGGFGNLWEGLGKTYYIPKVIKDVTGFKGVGAIKLSDGPLQVGTVIENSSLQDLACSDCHEVLGLRCASAPEGHLLKSDQLLLCAKKLSMESQRTGERAVLSVTKTHDLTKSSNNLSSPSKRPSMLSRAPLPSDIPRQSVEMPFTPAVSSPLMPGDSAMMSTIHEQRKDIDRIDAALRRFQKDIQDVKLFLKNFRQEMTEVRNTRPVTESTFQSLQQDVLCVSEKARGVDDLRTELYSLRARVKDMEKASRQAFVSDNRVLTTPELSDESQGRDMQNSISTGTWNQPSDVRGALIAEPSRALHRKRRYSGAESDQMEDKAAKLAKFGKYKRREELEGQQDENTGSNSIPPTRLATEEPATFSQRRTESPILGRYEKNGDADHTRQDDNVQHMEQHMERQISESPSQQIDTELTTLDEHNTIEENQRLKRISRATGSQIPELSQKTSSQSSNIPFRTLGGAPFTSDLPQNHFQSLNQRIEVPNSSQSGLSQDTQEQQLPAQPRRGPGRPRSTNKPIPPADSTPHAHRPRGRPKGSLNKIHSDSNISFRPSDEELSTPGRELRRRTIPVPGSSPPVKEIANTPGNNVVIDLAEKESGETGELREIGESPLAQSSQAQEHHSAVLRDVEMEDILQPVNPTKRQRRNTRSSRHRLSVDLDEIFNSRPANTNGDVAMATEEDYITGNKAKPDGRYLSGSKGPPSDEDETYTENYNAEKKKRQHQERKNEDELEEERKRGRKREREMDKEREERRSTRRRALERREELVKETLGMND
ncbi:e9a5ca29-f969-45f1-b345-d857e3ab81aa [Sclerotinia trifoliorum]|uniref:E9a5ca29-f969-45f1-b345-d857e3ab81aa n=1 Tax=Sclerotinia trifoliorum TaxID=28548 RepID=A0A8H2W3I5_9HELO|nr:e9a5ca29-f969-45f1-b345-d857e3ab81aa [Sclerotinia trifoliorum]